MTIVQHAKEIIQVFKFVQKNSYIYTEKEETCCKCKQNRFIYKDGNAYLKDYYILMNPQHSLQQLLQGNKLF